MREPAADLVCAPAARLLSQVATGTADIPSFTSVPPAKKEGQVLRYGPYEDTPPLTLKPIVGGALLCHRAWRVRLLCVRPALSLL